MAIGACAALPRDQGLGDVQRMVVEHSGQELAAPGTAAPALVTELLAAPLGVNAAVQLALINNPAVRRESARLGFAAADVYEAGRLANPVFSLKRLSPGDAAAENAQLTLGIAFNFVNLLFLPANNRYADARFEAAKLSMAGAAVDLATQVETAWYQAVGADQLAQLREVVSKAAHASAELAQRYFNAGNISRHELAMEQAAASQSLLDALSARARAVEARSQLNRLMGLRADQSGWTLDARLAEPLPNEDALQDLQQLSLDSRLDVASLRRRAQAIADRYGFTRRTRLVNGLEIGAERERDYDGAIHAGPTLSLELPLFNWGGGRVAAIQAALDQAEAELDERVLDTSNEVQLGVAKVSATKALAEQYRSALIPHREAIVAQAQAEQNYMLIGIFELILAKQQEYDAYAGYIEAVRDYWSARAELTRAVGRRLPSSQQAAKLTLDPVDVLRPKRGGIDHSKHAMGGTPHDMKGMDHSGHSLTAPAASVPAKADPSTAHDMGDMPMKGMQPSTPSSDESPQEAQDAHAH